MNYSLLKGIVLGVCLCYFCLKYINQIFIFIGNIFNVLSFIPGLERKSYTLTISSKIDSICSNIDADLFNKSLKIKIIKKNNLEEMYTKSGQKEITVHILNTKNPNKNIVSIINEYVKTSFVPNINAAIDRRFTKVNVQFIISKIVKRIKEPAVTACFNEGKEEIETKEEKLLQKKVMSMDRIGIYFPSFIDSLLYVEENLDQYLLDEKANEEVYNLVDYFYNIQFRKKKYPLTFTGNIFKVAVIMVASEETLNIAGLQAHINRIEYEANQGAERIYLRGIGKENIINVRRINKGINKIKYLNKIKEKEYSIADEKGKKINLLVVVYENYYESIAEIEKFEKEEIIKTLENYIPEVKNGLIEILSIEREKSIVTKVLVKSDNPEINTIACCIGANSKRIHNIEKDLLGEHINFIEYTEDIKELICKTLYPLRNEEIIGVKIKSKEKSAIVIVEDEKVGIAVGKLGINVKLSERLIGWNLDVRSKSEADKI